MTDFKGNLGKYKIIQTEDNTQTVWSEYFDEACHNLSGAYEETIYNYINGCNIPDQINCNAHTAILDVGFGVGLGLKSILDLLKLGQTQKIEVNYYSIELDEEFILWSFSNMLPELEIQRHHEHFENDELIYYRGIWTQNEIILNFNVFVGDGRTTLPLAGQNNLIRPLDAIFQDAFSPRKNPVLWTVEWFDFLRSVSNTSVYLSTYSSSVSIRKSLLAAGWKIIDAKGFANKKSMTKARLIGLSDKHLLEQMERSPTLELRDK